MAPKKVVAKKTAIDYPQKPLCANAPRPVPQVHPTVAADPMRASAIMLTQTKWVNGRVLHYCFFTSGPYTVPSVQADAVRNAFATWKAVGIGLDFIEIQNLADAEVRIAYSEAEGLSQSQVGRDILSVSVTEPTTQYGWDLTSPYGRGTALHELGHVLGLMHEHQSPFAGIVWNDDAVYASLEAPPNSWDASKVYENILLKLTPQQVDGSTWDPDSIMEYEFSPGLIVQPAQYANGLIPPGTLSDTDKAWALRWYPTQPSALSLLEPLKPVSANLAAGQQMDFAIRPTASRKYKLEAKGAKDSLLTLFEDIDGVPRFLDGDDDSGTERNAVVSQKLFKGRSYIARMRVVYPGQSGTASLLLS